MHEWFLHWDTRMSGLFGHHSPCTHLHSDRENSCKGMLQKRTQAIEQYALYYRPQRSWGKVIFSQASVILLTGGVWSQGGVSGPRGLSGPGGSASRGCLVLGGAWWRPPGRPLLRAVCILLECILVQFCD